MRHFRQIDCRHLVQSRDFACVDNEPAVVAFADTVWGFDDPEMHPGKFDCGWAVKLKRSRRTTDPELEVELNCTGRIVDCAFVKFSVMQTIR